uniref:UDP-N-acetylglucosamine pyrophosphorylase 1 n=1 Tax=Hucho hucho TaxID=62062 RepID=A0A4W5RGS0_9TELE
MLSFEEIKSSLEHAGQSHVLQFWAELSRDDKRTFLVELSGLDLTELREHCERAVESAKAGHSATAADQQIEPVSSEFIGSIRKSDHTALTGWENEGFLHISQNRVAVLLLAGGQGTRLGVPYPKGMYNVGLPSSKTLYQIQAERIRKIQELANAKHGSKCTVPW